MTNSDGARGDALSISECIGGLAHDPRGGEAVREAIQADGIEERAHNRHVERGVAGIADSIAKDAAGRPDSAASSGTKGVNASRAIDTGKVIIDEVDPRERVLTS